MPRKAALLGRAGPPYITNKTGETGCVVDLFEPRCGGSQDDRQDNYRAMEIPVHFPNGNKTDDGLSEVAKWLLDHERAQLSGELVFPQAGQVCETAGECVGGWRRRDERN